MKNLLQKPVSAFMTRKVIAVTPKMPIRKLFQILKKHKIGGAPVVNQKRKVVGIVTESDLIRHFTTLKTPRGVHILGSLLYLDDLRKFNQELKEHCTETVAGLMTRPAVTISANARLSEALDLMADRHINRLPVVDKAGKLVGLLTRTNLIRALTKVPA